MRNSNLHTVCVLLSSLFILSIGGQANAQPDDWLITRLTDNNYRDWDPQIYGSRVVWAGEDADGAEIFSYDGSTITQLTDNNFPDTSPQLYGSNVVWVGQPGKDTFDGTEIFFAKLLLPPIEAGVKIRPNTLNLQSEGKWFTCRISLPEGYDVADIDPDSILLEDEIPADRVWLLNKFAVAKFNRSALRELLADLETPATVELLLSGQLNDGTPFEGTDTIKLIDKAPKKNPPRVSILRRKR